MANIKNNAALARRQNCRLHLSLRRAGRIRKRPERMREHIARPQHINHFLVVRRRMIDMRHERHADLIGNLQRALQRLDRLIA